MKITNKFTTSLPSDPILENYQRQVNNSCFSYVNPTKVVAPELISYSESVAALLNLDNAHVKSPEFLEVISGNKNFEGSKPYAMCYGGHQFGHWAGQLGDGRAINIADIEVNGNQWTLQLKGAGQTPYSRTADGLAVLRSSIREYLCSEAMYYLGVPTTRALAIVSTGEKVYRDMFYDGNAAYEPGAIVTRVAPSFLRFGNYEIFAARKDLTNLKLLVDYTISNYFPHLGEPSKEIYLQWLSEIGERTLDLMIDWQRVGFVHGVMNTDNMSILGLTIDYGPYGWLEAYDGRWTPNTTDAHGKRYAYGNQPNMGVWNLIKLYNAIYPLIEDQESMQALVDKLPNYFSDNYQKMLANKLGIASWDNECLELIKSLFGIMDKQDTDYIIFFRNLIDLDLTNPISELPKSVSDAIYEEELTPQEIEIWLEWLNSYRSYLINHSISNDDRIALLRKTNPKYVLRNYMAYEIIEKSTAGDHSLLYEVEKMLTNPYVDNPDYDHWYKKRPDWAKTKAGCSMLSCSS
jgi:serine/tyrosine/threonine adenylyltransferase